MEIYNCIVGNAYQIDDNEYFCLRTGFTLDVVNLPDPLLICRNYNCAHCHSEPILVNDVFCTSDRYNKSHRMYYYPDTGAWVCKDLNRCTLQCGDKRPLTLISTRPLKVKPTNRLGD